jgi:IS5 family transposase
MTLLAYIHVLFHLPFRQEEGFVRALSKYVHNLKVPDFRTIWWRTNRLDINLEGIDTDQPIVVAIDSTGIKVSNYGDWIRKKWKVKRGFLKVHLAVDVNSKEAVSMTVTEEDVSDGSQAKDLVNGALSKNNVERLYGDGAYDSRDIFNFLVEKGIDPAIKVRRNSSGRARGSQARKAAVIA